MPDLTAVADYIEWAERRTLDGKTSTLEEYREFLGDERRRMALAHIAHITDPNRPEPGPDAVELVGAVYSIAIQALKEES